MQESLFLLHYIFGWKPIRNNIFENKSPDSDEIKFSPEAQEKIDLWTRRDKEIYEYGKQIFEKQYAQMVKELTDKYYEPRFDNMEPNDAVYEMLKKNYDDQITHNE